MEHTSPAPKWRRRKEERPTEIIAAAYAVFTDKGFAAAKLDDIAARAGVSKGALYLYFETKQEIFEAVVRSAIAPNIDMIRTMAEAYDGPLEPLLRQIISRVQTAIGFHFGPVIRMVIGEGRNFPEIARIWHDQMVEPGLGMLTGIIERAQARGEVRPGDPRAFCVSLISPILAAVIIRETFVPVGAKPFDIPALMQQHLDTVLPGMLAAKAT
jgi:AcrR family transcriptional regulator